MRRTATFSRPLCKSELAIRPAALHNRGQVNPLLPRRFCHAHACHIYPAGLPSFLG